MNDTTDPISSPVLKIISAWIAAGFAQIGVSSWSDFAAFVAGMYTCMLAIEFLWRKIVKPIALRHGWLCKQQEWVGGDDAND